MKEILLKGRSISIPRLALVILFGLLCGHFIWWNLKPLSGDRTDYWCSVAVFLTVQMAILLKIRFLNSRIPVLLGMLRFFYLLLLSALAGSVIHLVLYPKNHAYLRDHFSSYHLALIGIIFAFTITILWRIHGLEGLLSKATNRFVKWATAIVFSLVVLYYSAENWKGKRLWAAAQKEMAARGEKPGLDSLTPPPVPDEDDAAKTAILAPLSNYTKTNGNVVYQNKMACDRLESIRLPISEPLWFSQPSWLRQHPIDLAALVEKIRLEKSTYHFLPPPTATTPEEALLEYLNQYSTELEAIRMASERPYARFKLIYEDGSLAASHLPLFDNVATVFDHRALAELKTGKTNEAFEDVCCALRLSNLQFQQDSMIDYGVGVRMTLRAIQPIWEGMASGQWSESQLAALQSYLGKISPLTDFEHWAKTHFWLYMDVINQAIPIDNYSSTHRFLQMNEKSAAYFLTAIRMVYPKGWSYQDQADLYFQYRGMLEIVDISQQRIYKMKTAETPTSISSDPLYLGLEMPKTCELREGFPRTTARAQTGVNLAQVACALERYKLANGTYPKKTSELVPQFMEKVPHDILNGEPLHYRLNANGHYTLYSVGWNLTDEQGTTVTEKDTGVDNDQGDWVWEFSKAK